VIKGTFFGAFMGASFAIPLGIAIGPWGLGLAVVNGVLCGIFMGIAIKIDWEPSPRLTRFVHSWSQVAPPPGAAPYMPPAFVPEDDESANAKR
jgi:hypothetical protein